MSAEGRSDAEGFELSVVTVVIGGIASFVMRLPEGGMTIMTQCPDDEKTPPPAETGGGASFPKTRAYGPVDYSTTTIFLVALCVGVSNW